MQWLWTPLLLHEAFAVETLYAKESESSLENGYIKLGFRYTTTLKAYSSNPALFVILFYEKVYVNKSNRV